ncbi:hypothetical protein J3D56_000712 [Erwinia persicina]|jgi:hypothetical protein|nr:hypothetical protein [Erwinia persicina]
MPRIITSCLILLVLAVLIINYSVPIRFAVEDLLYHLALFLMRLRSP